MHEYGAEEAVCVRTVDGALWWPKARCEMGITSLPTTEHWTHDETAGRRIVYYGDAIGKIETDDEAYKNDDAYKIDRNA